MQEKALVLTLLVLISVNSLATTAAPDCEVVRTAPAYSHLMLVVNIETSMALACDYGELEVVSIAMPVNHLESGVCTFQTRSFTRESPSGTWVEPPDGLIRYFAATAKCPAVFAPEFVAVSGVSAGLFTQLWTFWTSLDANPKEFARILDTSGMGGYSLPSIKETIRRTHRVSDVARWTSVSLDYADYGIQYLLHFSSPTGTFALQVDVTQAVVEPIK